MSKFFLLSVFVCATISAQETTTSNICVNTTDYFPDALVDGVKCYDAIENNSDFIGFDWSSLGQDCSNLADDEYDSVVNFISQVGPECCGGGELRCVHPKMCKKREFYDGTKTFTGSDNTCDDFSIGWLSQRGFSSWVDVKCENLSDADKMELRSGAFTCCGELSNVLCADDSTICKIPENYSPHTVIDVDEESGQDITCNYTSVYLMNEYGLDSWSDILANNCTALNEHDRVVIAMLGGDCCGGSRDQAKNCGPQSCAAVLNTFGVSCSDVGASDVTPENPRYHDAFSSGVTEEAVMGQCCEQPLPPAENPETNPVTQPAENPAPESPEGKDCVFHPDCVVPGVFSGWCHNDGTSTVGKCVPKKTECSSCMWTEECEAALSCFGIGAEPMLCQKDDTTSQCGSHAENPGTYPVTQPAENPGTYPVTQPAENPGTYPVTQPAENPGTYPVTQPAENPYVSLMPECMTNCMHICKEEPTKYSSMLEYGMALTDCMTSDAAFHYCGTALWFNDYAPLYMKCNKVHVAAVLEDLAPLNLKQKMTAAAKKFQSKMRCGPGQFVRAKYKKNPRCNACPAGKYNKKAYRNKRCKKCPKNTFAPYLYHDHCEKCPQGFNTKGQKGKKQCFHSESGKSMKSLGMDFKVNPDPKEDPYYTKGPNYIEN